MNAEIEKMIKLAVEGGEISDTQRRTILRKAIEMGEDIDEVQFSLKIALKEAEQEVLEKAAKEKAEKEQAERERAERERAEKERAEKERAERERADRGQTARIQKVEEDSIPLNSGLLVTLEKLESMLSDLQKSLSEVGAMDKDSNKQKMIQIQSSIRLAKSRFGNDAKLQAFEDAYNATIENAEKERKKSRVHGVIFIAICVIAYIIYTLLKS